MLFYSLLIQIYFRKRVVRENQCGGTGGSLHTAEVQANSPAQESVVYIYYVKYTSNINIKYTYQQYQYQIYQQYQYQYQIYVLAISISNIPAISISISNIRTSNINIKYTSNINIKKAIMFASGRCSSQLWSRKNEF